MSTLMDKYNFNSDQFEYVQPNEESYASNYINNWNDNNHNNNTQYNNNDTYVNHVSIVRNDNVNNNTYNTSNSFNCNIDLADDDLPPPRPQLTRCHSNINPTITINNNNNISTTTHPPIQPTHTQLNTQHNNCNCIPYTTPISQYNPPTNSDYNYKPTPIHGLQDPLTSNVLTLHSSLHTSNSNDTCCSNSQPNTIYNPFYSNKSYNQNQNQSQIPINTPHISPQIHGIQAQKMNGNCQPSGYYENQPQCSCYNNHRFNNIHNQHMYNGINPDYRGIPASTDTSTHVRYANVTPNPFNHCTETDTDTESLRLETLFSALRSGVNTGEMALIIARMVSGICGGTNCRKITLQTLMNCNIINILTNAMRIYHNYPLVVEQCQVALNHLNRIKAQQTVANAPQIGMYTPQTGGGGGQLYASNSNIKPHNYGRFGHAEFPKKLIQRNRNVSVNHVNHMHVQRIKTPEIVATVTETVATLTARKTVNKPKKNSKKRRLSIPSLEPIKKRKMNEFVSLNSCCDGGYKCKKCGKVYKYICNLRSHSKIHTADAHVCEFCNKRFGRKANYVEHKRVHTGEQPFKCEICQRGFKQRYGWKDHMKIHKNDS